MASIIIQPERAKPVRNRHPWIFSGAVLKVEGKPEPGEIVDIILPDNEFLAKGYYNVNSQIQVRLLSWEDETIDREWWRNKLQQAISLRGELKSNSAVRLINAENDFLPGLIVDQYGDWLVLQALTLGIDVRKDEIADLLAEIVKPKGIYERSDVDVRKLEGLNLAVSVLWGEEPPAHIEIEEAGVKLLVDIRTGHKTGTYLDQSLNRTTAGAWVRRKGIKRVLNVFSYTGGFGLHAARAGAEVVNIDSSSEALATAEQAFVRNGLKGEFAEADAFAYLRGAIEDQEQYDMIILDPPKFAQNKGQVDRAARGYKDINLHAFRLVQPGGYVFTFSCSGAINADLFQKIVFGALADSGREGQIVRTLGPGEDHPIALTFPEGAYLKGLLIRVL
jgi:23S rRNA (cytosine1962-C5)-methyltransferase